MARGDFRINGILLPKNTLKPIKGRIDFIVEERSIDNTLCSDVRGTKVTRKFVWENALDEDFISQMQALYLASEDVTLVEVNSDLTETTYTMSIKAAEDITQEVIDEESYAYSGFTLYMEEV